MLYLLQRYQLLVALKIGLDNGPYFALCHFRIIVAANKLPFQAEKLLIKHFIIYLSFDGNCCLAIKQFIPNNPDICPVSLIGFPPLLSHVTPSLICSVICIPAFLLSYDYIFAISFPQFLVVVLLMHPTRRCQLMAISSLNHIIVFSF